MVGQIHESAAVFLCTEPPKLIEQEKGLAAELIVTIWGRPKTLIQGIKPPIPRLSSL
jgi:hypothetical protein